MKSVSVDLIEIPDKKAQAITDLVIQSLCERNIPMENVIGFCADTCNLFGPHHSVSKVLTDRYPWIMPVKCSCHSIHLCASHACKTLPKSLENLCRNNYEHFNASSKQMDCVKDFQEFFGTEKHVTGYTDNMALNEVLCK
eukprot:gene17073-8591_t